jgi:CMP/dCMP kinase
VIVAIDGPSGAGKTSVSREVARRLGMALLDTGALYRGAALLADEHGVDFDDGPAVAALIERAAFGFAISGEGSRLHIDGRDVSEAIRTPRLSEGSSRVSSRPEVRAALLDLQRELGRASDCVVEGRDIGTVVFPDAEYKFFLTASLGARVERRRAEYEAKGQRADEETMRREVVERDERDAARDVAPLRPADDAVVLDSTQMTLEEVVEAIVSAVRGR